jgi:hypothetical protein
MRKLAALGIVVLLAFYCCSVRQHDNALVLKADKLMVQVDKLGETTSKNCEPCFGKMRWQKSLLLKSDILLTLTMYRDFTIHPWGFSPSDNVYDVLEVETMKKNFKITLSGGFDDKEQNEDGERKRKRVILAKEGDEDFLTMAVFSQQ